MKVVHVEAGPRLYGGAEQVRCLIEGLAAQGVRNVLVCPPGAEIARAACAAEVVEMPMAGELDLRFAARLRSALRNLRADVLHVHSRRGADLHAGRACRGEALAAIVTRRVESREPGWWLRWKYRPYRAVVAISRAIERDLMGRVGLARERVHRVPSGVDVARFAPRAAARARLLTAFDLPDEAFVAGTVAQLIPRKGHALLLEALPALLRRHARLRVLLFGRGRLERALRSRIVALGLDGRVRLAGFRRDLPDLLAGLDVLVHAATREGLGVALLEGSAAGVPVVACAAGGVLDVVRDGETGLLVQPQPTALAAALERLIANDGERSRMGAAARARIEAEFSAARMAAGNLALYRRVLQDGGP